MSDTTPSLSDLKVEEIAAAIEAKKTELAEAVEAAESVEQIEAAEQIAADIDAHEVELATREAAAAELADRKAALTSKFADKGDDGDGDEPAKDEPVEPAEEPAPVEEPAAVEPEAVIAPVADITPAVETPAPVPVAAAVEAPKVSAAVKTVAELAARTTKPNTPSRSRGTNMLNITAAANLDDFQGGSKLAGVEDIAKAVLSKTTAFHPPQGDGTHEALSKTPIARISLGFDETNTIDKRSDDMAILASVASESNIKNRDGEEFDSLVAAGGWCAPSETLYDLCEGETLDGILSLPEVNIARGGINYTPGPNFADFYGASGPGFKQTETQAIAGTTKTCVEVSCPSFTEVRLDAVGVCIKVPILTESAYPELVERFTRGTLVAHAHQVNRDVIGRLVAASNTSRTIALTGSTVDDALEGLELVTNQKRQQYRLGFNDTLEVVVPFWVKGVYRADLSRRQGITPEQITDAAIEAHFAARGLNVQWVYDWQDIDLTLEVYPTTYRVLVFKAGTFIKGTSDVISLSAVYDAASLATNTYTGLFAEQGLLVAKMCWDSENILLPVCNAGRRGALNITCS